MTFEPDTSEALGFVQEAFEDVRAQREHRSEVLHRARLARSWARDLRDRAESTRDVTLGHRWHLWSAGFVGEPPSFVPESWRAEHHADRESLLDDAALACRECYERALRVGRVRVLAGLCDVTATRVVGREDGYEFLLSATARLIEQLEPSLDSDEPRVILCLSSMRRCRDTCQAALVALKE